MTDTSTPQFSWTALLQALAPSLNQAVLLIVTAIIGGVSTLGAQYMLGLPSLSPTAPAPPAQVRTVESSKVVVDPAVAKKLAEIDVVLGQLVSQVDVVLKEYEDWIDAVKAELAQRAAARKAKTPKVPARAAPAP